MSGWETRDADARKIGALTALLLAGFGAVMAAALGLDRLFLRVSPFPGRALSALARPRRAPPEPRLQTDPAADLRLMREEEDRQLGTYGWIDRRSGRARIPIDRAIALALRRGLPPELEKGRKEASW